MDPFAIFAATFAMTSAAGLAALMRSGKSVSFRSLLSAGLYNGCLGLAIALIWYFWYDGNDANTYFMMGVSMLAGLGGATATDLLLLLWKKGKLAMKHGGIKIVISQEEDKQ